MKNTFKYIISGALLFTLTQGLKGQNTTLGTYAGMYNTGTDNVFVGYSSGTNSGTATKTVVIGKSSGSYSTGNYNTILGTDNTYLTGSNGVVIGYGNTGVSIDNQLYIGIANSPLITGDFTTKAITFGRISSTAIKTVVTTDYGYVEIGAQNATYVHFMTDRAQFYFNKKIIVDEGSIASYDENLVFKTDLTETRMTINNSTGYVGIGTTSPSQMLQVEGNVQMANAGGYLYKTKGIAFTWSSSYGTSSHILYHGITSTLDGGTYSDNLTMNSYGDIRLNFDSNNNGTANKFSIGNNGTGAAYTLFQVNENGQVLIGTTTAALNTAYKLAVAGKVLAEEVQVSAAGTSPWPDYVFAPGYNLRPLAEVERFVKENRHLPELPKASEVEQNGVGLGEMNALLLKKIEELTLYVIEQNKKIDELQAKVEKIEK